MSPRSEEFIDETNEEQSPVLASQTPRGSLISSESVITKKDSKKEVVVKKKSLKMTQQMTLEQLSMRVNIIESQMQAIFQMMVEMNATIDAIAIKNGITPVHEARPTMPQASSTPKLDPLTAENFTSESAPPADVDDVSSEAANQSVEEIEASPRHTPTSKHKKSSLSASSTLSEQPNDAPQQKKKTRISRVFGK